MFNSNKQIKMVGLQGNTIHCSKSESLSSLGFFVIDAAAFAAAALGVLEAAEVTIGEESESEDSLSSLPKLDSESESFFFLVLDAFFVDATGLADLDTAGFDAVDLTPALALEVEGTDLDPPAVDFDLAALGLEFALESESESESESDFAFFLEGTAALGAATLGGALLAAAGFAAAVVGAFAAGNVFTPTAADLTTAA